MSKPTFEELTVAFNELMDALEKSKREAELAAAKEESFVEEPSMTPLEELISNRIAKHLEQGTFPSLEEAQAIHILDSINYRYNR